MTSSFLYSNLLIDPTGGTPIFDDSATIDDKSSEDRPLGFTGLFFEKPKTYINIATNGTANFSKNTSYSTAPMPTDVERLNVFWADLDIKAGTGSTIIEKIVPGTYYSVTWKKIQPHGNTGEDYTFQLVWFGDNYVINGFEFNPNDIVYTFEGPNTVLPGGRITVGLDSGGGANSQFAAFSGVAGGVITNSTINLIPCEQGGFLLFRADGNGYAEFIGTSKLQNPRISPTADFIVTNAVNTESSGDQTTVNALNFANGSSLTIDKTLKVTSGVLQVPTGSSTITGTIAGDKGLTKTGEGTLTLNGTNTYTGPTTIEAGTLKLGTQGSIPSTEGVVLADKAGATLDLNNFSTTIASLSGGGTQGGTVNLGSGTLTVGDASNTTYAGTINGTGGLVKQGTGTLKLTGTNTYSGETTIREGTLEGNSSNLKGDISNSGMLAFDQTEEGTYAGNITGSGGMTKKGPGTLVLKGSNSYTGSTTVLEGTLQGNTSSLQGDISNSGTVTFDQKSAGTYAGTISGTGGLSKQGSETLTLSGNNSYTGPTTINEGTLKLGTQNSLPSQGGVSLANGAGVTLDLNNFSTTISSLSGGGNQGGNVNLGSGTLTVGDSSSSTYAGSISGSGGLTKEGSGTLTLSGNSSYTGPTTINEGTLKMGAQNATSPNGAVTLSDSKSSTLDLNNFSTTIGSLTGGGNVLLGTGTLSVGDDSSSTYSGTVSGSGGLTKKGSGTLTLAGNSTYTGPTTIDAGTLKLGSQNGLSSQGGVTLANASGTTLDLNNFSTTISSLSGGGNQGGNINLGSGTLSVGDSSSSTYAGAISGSGGLTKKGSGTLTLNGNNTYTGPTTILEGTLEGNTSSLTGDISNGGALVFNQTNAGTYSGTISGSGGLTKKGTGTLTLSGNSTYTGPTTILEGTLQGNTSNLKGNISNSGTVVFDQVSEGTYPGAISGSGGLTKKGGGTLTLAGNSTYTGPTTVLEGTLQGNTSSLRGNISNSGTVAFNQTSAGTYPGIISGSGGLTKNGSETLTLSGNNTYTGPTTINGGTVKLGAQNGLPPGGIVTLSDKERSVLDLNNFSTSIGSLSGGGQVNLGTGNLTLNCTSSSTYSGVITGTGGLTKKGEGTLTLDGRNTYTGPTTVLAGTLQGSGANLKGDIVNQGTVAFNESSTGTYAGIISGSGGLEKNGPGTLILSGNNTYGGSTTISEGTLKLGAKNTTPSGGSVTLSNSTKAIFDLNNFSTTIGSLAGGGTVNLGTGNLTVGDSSDTTYSGVIAGAGSLTKKGTGTLTLDGPNTYTGSTTVLEGALQGSSTNLVGNITNNGTVIFNETLEGTYSGTISGTGGLTKKGAGTLILTQANTYTGPTKVVEGTLQGNTSSLPGNIENTGTVIFDQLSAGTYTGAISGTGGLTKKGAETLILTGNNTYTGSTTILEGMIQTSASNLTGNITNNGTIAFDETAQGTYSGVISGSGGLIKKGTGALTLTETNDYNGPTTLMEGELLIQNGSNIGLSANPLILSGGNLHPSDSFQLSHPVQIDSGIITVDEDMNFELDLIVKGNGHLIKNGEGKLILSSSESTYSGLTSLKEGKLTLKEISWGDIDIAESGILTGNGTTGTINNSGTISPGASIGVLKLEGDFVQVPTGTLMIEINNDPDSDLIEISGSASLDGTIQLNPMPGIYTEGTKFTFLKAGSITGTFQSLQETHPLDFSLIYDHNSVSIFIPVTATVLPIPLQYLSGNTRSLGLSFFKHLTPTYPDELMPIANILLKLPPLDFAQALLQLGPEQFGGLARSNLQSHVRINSMMNQTRAVYDECRSLKKNQEPLNAFVWTNSLGYYYKQNERENQPSFRDTTFGFTTGYTHTFFNHLVVSGGIGYSHSQISWKGENGDAEIQSLFLSPSVGYFGQYGHVELVMTGSKSFYNVNRNIQFPSFKKRAHNDHTSKNFSVGLEGGIRVKLPETLQRDLYLLPSCKVDYIDICEKGYQESGAAPIHLYVKKKHSSFLHSECTLKLLKEITNAAFCISPAIYAGWLNNISFSRKTHEAMFYEHQAYAFTVDTYSKALNQLILGMDLVFSYQNNLKMKAKYEANLGEHALVQEGRFDFSYHF